MTEVRVVRRKSNLMLVEWQDSEIPKRAWVSGDMIREDKGETALVDRPDAGVPYGVEFWRLFRLNKVTPQDVDKALKRRGIWTIADLRADPNAALAAIQSVYGFNLSALLLAADKYEKDLKEVVDYGSASL